MSLPDTEVLDVPANLAQRSTLNLGSAIESATTTVALADLLVPLGYTLTERTTVVDVDGVLGVPGAQLRVEGRPARRPRYQAAALRWVSDLQEG